MIKLPVVALGAAGSLLAVSASAAYAGSFDLAPVLNTTIDSVLQPVACAVGSVVAGMVVLPLRRFLDQKAGDLMAARVNDLLDKAIAFAAQSGEKWVTEQDFHVNVDGWLANIAADYAMRQAPTLLKKAGALAANKAPDLIEAGLNKLLLHEKIDARLASHPAVAALKALAPAPAPADAA